VAADVGPEIPRSIRRIIAADALLIRIHRQHILRPIRIVLKRRQRLNEPTLQAPPGRRETLPV